MAWSKPQRVGLTLVPMIRGAWNQEGRGWADRGTGTLDRQTKGWKFLERQAEAVEKDRGMGP